MHQAAELNARLARAIEDLRDLAGRVDSNGSERVFDQLMRPGDLTDTVVFLRHAHELLINVAEILTLVIGASHTHGDSSDQPDSRLHPKVPALTPHEHIPVDATEAWRRAHLYLPGHHDNPILIHIQEFEDGYQAIPILATIPEPPSVPTIDTPTTLVIDKTTGTVTRWPLLPLDVLAKQYRRYQHQERMTFDDHAERR
ncbi:hypothetical protein [Spirillospora sp. NPDC048823]|uniref:hypothetical protein n=1 Tax=unclassified Spirillospora TaxID=2642701 RepID=UPI00371AE70F